MISVLMQVSHDTAYRAVFDYRLLKPSNHKKCQECCDTKIQQRITVHSFRWDNLENIEQKIIVKYVHIDIWLQVYFFDIQSAKSSLASLSSRCQQFPLYFIPTLTSTQCSDKRYNSFLFVIVVANQSEAIKIVDDGMQSSNNELN